MHVAATLGAVPVSVQSMCSCSLAPLLKRIEKMTNTRENHKLFCHFTKLDVYRFLEMVQLQSCVFWIHIIKKKFRLYHSNARQVLSSYPNLTKQPAFSHFRKTTESDYSFVTSAFLSVRVENSAPTGRIFTQFDMSIFKKLVEIMQRWLKSDKKYGYHAGIPMYVNGNTSLNSS